MTRRKSKLCQSTAAKSRTSLPLISLETSKSINFQKFSRVVPQHPATSLIPRSCLRGVRFRLFSLRFCLLFFWLFERFAKNIPLPTILLWKLRNRLLQDCEMIDWVDLCERQLGENSCFQLQQQPLGRMEVATQLPEIAMDM